ncbi:MAG: HD domain-containing protein [Acidimicrobiales bacterium]
MVTGRPPTDESSGEPDEPLEARSDRLDAQLAFVLEADRLKQVERRGTLADGSRRERTAEHSWHLSLMAMVLAEHAAEPVDRLRALELVIVHDIVEIDAGDTFVYDEAGQGDKAERERAAADRLFGLLPDDQAERFRALWDEFEARETVEARFAASLDRLSPLMLNHSAEGAVWKEHGITGDQVRARNQQIAAGAPELWQAARWLIADAVDRGYLDGGAAPRIVDTDQPALGPGTG